MNAIAHHDFEGNSVRSIIRDGEPWFVLADVCRVLEVGNPSQAATRLDDDEKDTLTNIEGIAAAQVQAITIINESGLYSLILTSRKPSAKRFKKWVTSEVLPALRKTGRYDMPSFQRSGAGAVNQADDEFGPLDAVSLKVRMVALANKLGGPAAGRQLWARFGLPELSVPQRAQSDVEFMLGHIRRAGVISRRDLFQRMKARMPQPRFQDCLDALTADGLISTVRGTSGRPGVRPTLYRPN